MGLRAETTPPMLWRHRGGGIGAATDGLARGCSATNGGGPPWRPCWWLPQSDLPFRLEEPLLQRR
jgi:hypothetical protein